MYIITSRLICLYLITSVVENSDNLFYDLNGISENADSIYWTLVPNEMFAIYQQIELTQ